MLVHPQSISKYIFNFKGNYTNTEGDNVINKRKLIIVLFIYTNNFHSYNSMVVRDAPIMNILM